jgi:hypothetical protein
MNDALCDTIRNAFSGVKLGKGIGLSETQGLDDYDDAATRTSAPSMATGLIPTLPRVSVTPNHLRRGGPSDWLATRALEAG